MTCPLSASSRPPPSSAPAPYLRRPAADTEFFCPLGPEQAASPGGPSAAEIAAASWPLLRNVPRDLAPILAKSLSWTLDRCGTADAAPWLAFLAFAKVLLQRPKGKRTSVSLQALIRARCRRWVAGDFPALWEEAKEAQPPPGKATTAEGFPLDDDWLPPHLRAMFGTEVRILDATTLRRVTDLAKRKWFSKAAAALGAARVAPVNEESLAEMRAKHPFVPPPPATPMPATASHLPPFSVGDIRRCLRQFPLGSAGGLSALTPAHLKDLLAFPATSLYGSISRFLGLLAAGTVPDSVRPVLFGARLIALVKKDKSLRPIASGDVMRRLCGKLLCAATRTKAAAYLVSHGQIGVAVPAGADAMVRAARRYSDLIRASPPARDVANTRVIVKLDKRNAFNEGNRETALAAIDEHFPELSGYARCALGAHTHLLFGDQVIPSASGFQQGDPLSVVGYSVNEASLDTEIRPRLAQQMLEAHDAGLLDEAPSPDMPLDLHALFLDDGCHGGPALAVRFFVDLILELGPKYGIHLNMSKCEVISNDAAAAHEMFPDFGTHASCDDWELLGSPCGSVDSCRAYVDRAVKRAINKCRAIASLEHDHVAFALQRFCGGFGLGVHYMRMVGPVAMDSFLELDTVTLNIANEVTSACITSEDSYAPLALPFRHGGFGFRPTHQHAAIAYISAEHDTRSLRSKLLQPLLDLPVDLLLEAATSDHFVHHYPSVLDKCTSLMNDSDQVRHAQREVSQELEKCQFEVYIASLAPDDAARVRSCASPHASAWLLPYDSVYGAANCWLGNAEFSALCKHRLGLPVTDRASTCRLCGKVEADTRGYHSLTCMGSGLRTRAHHALRDAIYEIAGTALLCPRKEGGPFAAQPSLRADVVLTGAGFGRPHAIDCAIVHPAQARFRAAASTTAAGAATAYEAVKRAKYGAFAAAEHVKLVPAVVDVYGGFSTSFLELIRTLARPWGRRFDLAPCRSIPLVASRLNLVLMRSIARILLFNATPGDAAPDAEAPAPDDLGAATQTDVADEAAPAAASADPLLSADDEAPAPDDLRAATQTGVADEAAPADFLPSADDDRALTLTLTA